MSDLTQGILIALIPALIVSIITAYVTVKLSMKRFYSERWWEKKAEAYSAILEHLSYVKYYLGEWEADELAEKTLPEEAQRELSDNYHKSRESLIRATAFGSYIISDNAATSIAELMHELDRYDYRDKMSDIERKYTPVVKCIERIRQDAKLSLTKN